MLCLPVLNAPGAPRSLENRGRSSPRPPEVQTGFERERDAVSCLPCLRPRCFQRLLTAPLPPHSLSHTMERSRSRPLVQAGPRSSYSSGSLSERKIYVNRHVDTCLNVAGARARAERGEVRDRERRAWKSGYWYAVSDFAVSRVEGEGGETHTSEMQ